MIASASVLRGTPAPSNLSASAASLGWESKPVCEHTLTEWRAGGRHITDFYTLNDRVSDIYLSAMVYLEFIGGRPFWRLELRRGIGCRDHGVRSEDIQLALPLWPKGAYPRPVVNWHPECPEYAGVTLEEQREWAA